MLDVCPSIMDQQLKNETASLKTVKFSSGSSELSCTAHKWLQTSLTKACLLLS